MSLTADQEELLQTLVEEWRALPRERRSEFLNIPYDGGHSHYLFVLPNPSKFHLQAYSGDIDSLIDEGLLRPKHGSRGLFAVSLTNRAFEYYDAMMQRAGEPSSKIEATIRRFLDSDRLQSQYSQALEKLFAAEELLWQGEVEADLTAIGHYSREAMQLFASALVERFGLTEIDPSPAKTINRIGAVLAHCAEKLGSRETALLEALRTYWQAVNDFVQRQEHGSHAAGRELTWDDARRTVFYTMLVFVEIDRAVARATREL